VRRPRPTRGLSCQERENKNHNVTVLQVSNLISLNLNGRNTGDNIMKTSMLQVLNANLTLQYTVNFYNLNIHKTEVHLHRTLHTNASRDQNAVVDIEINQFLNLQN